MVKYFKEDLKPSIKAEMDQDDSQLVDYEELVAKGVRAEAKASLRPSSYVLETDLSCLRGNRPPHNTAHKVQTQGVVTRGDESKAKASVSAPAQDSEPSNKSRRDKNKKHYREKKDSKKPKESTTPASGVNAAEVGGKEKRKNKKDPRKVMCYNSNKLGHYVNACPEPRPKNLYRSRRPPRR